MDVAVKSNDELAVHAAAAARLLKLVANERRLLILCRLASAGEASVGELARIVGLSQSALSQHLAKLRRDSLVRTRRDAQTIYYSLASREPEPLVARASRGRWVQLLGGTPDGSEEGAAEAPLERRVALEDRVAALEQELERLKDQFERIGSLLPPPCHDHQG